MKALTRKELEGRKEKAARSVENVLGDPGRAHGMIYQRDGDKSQNSPDWGRPAI